MYTGEKADCYNARLTDTISKANPYVNIPKVLHTFPIRTMKWFL